MQRIVIRVAGHLDAKWTDWLGGLTLTHAQGDETVLAGDIVDQAALYGVFARLRDLGARIIAVDSREPRPLSEPPDRDG